MLLLSLFWKCSLIDERTKCSWIFSLCFESVWPKLFNFFLVFFFFSWGFFWFFLGFFPYFFFLGFFLFFLLVFSYLFFLTYFFLTHLLLTYFIIIKVFLCVEILYSLSGLKLAAWVLCRIVFVLLSFLFPHVSSASSFLHCQVLAVVSVALPCRRMLTDAFQCKEVLSRSKLIKRSG